jgi:hypothetical protein
MDSPGNRPAPGRWVLFPPRAGETNWPAGLALRRLMNPRPLLARPGRDDVRDAAGPAELGAYWLVGRRPDNLWEK